MRRHDRHWAAHACRKTHDVMAPGQRGRCSVSTLGSATFARGFVPLPLRLHAAEARLASVVGITAGVNSQARDRPKEGARLSGSSSELDCPSRNCIPSLLASIQVETSFFSAMRPVSLHLSCVVLRCDTKAPNCNQHRAHRNLGRRSRSELSALSTSEDSGDNPSLLTVVLKR